MSPSKRPSKCSIALFLALALATWPELIHGLALKVDEAPTQTTEGGRGKALLKLLVSHAKRYAGLQDPPDFGPGEGPHIVVDGNGQAINSDEVMKQKLMATVIYLTTVMIWGGVVYLIASWYLSSIKVKAAPRSSQSEEMLNEFKHGPFDCFSDVKTTCWVCFCPSIRWADNVSSLGIMRSFWLAMLIYFGLFAILSLEGDLVSLILLACVGAGFRRELRLKFKMPVSAALFAQDCLLWACCSCCALVQEVRQVEEASKLGHPSIVDPDEEPASQV